VLSISFGNLGAHRPDKRQDLLERHFFVIVVNAEFGVPEIAAKVNVRYAGARLDQLLELLHSAEFVCLAGNDNAQLELTCRAAGFRGARARRSLRLGMMMVMIVVMVVMVVITMMIMVIMLMVVMIVPVFVFRFRHENL
jgi:hypothetical protein